MTETDFQGGADRNPRISGVDLDCKPTLRADLTSGPGQKKWWCICTGCTCPDSQVGVAFALKFCITPKENIISSGISILQ